MSTLLDRGADVNILDNEGNSALFYAAMDESCETAHLLIDANADVNTMNRYVYSFLFISFSSSSRSKCFLRLYIFVD